jgi:hydroxylamine reductase
MFCFQCQETAGNKGCTVKGVCGKSPETANVMDTLIHETAQLAAANYALRNKKLNLKETDSILLDALFSTITNVNFDTQTIEKRVTKVREVTKKLELIAEENGIEIPEITTNIGVLSEADEDIRSLKQLIIYGVKGAAAYAKHAFNLNFEEAEINETLEFALKEASRNDITINELLPLTLKVGEIGVKAMALLDKANTTTFGHPEITKVNIGVGNKPGILVSGHDLKDFQELLEQTQESGVDIYTHSEMLPAHYYPAFKKYSHFKGNYGNAWWQQREEFETFNGPILFTTNCIVPPAASSTYGDRIYTTGSVGLPGAYHIDEQKNGKPKDFSGLIAHAKRCTPPQAIEEGEIIGGFAHNQVLALADKVVEAVKTGAIKQFVVMAGCDGRMKSRDYYTQFAQNLPQDNVILTAGCAKYRYNKLNLGDISGIPRVLDAGQCNDSYSLVLIALALKDAFGLKDVNELPIIYNIAWYEQKAVIVLLALLSLGVKNIHLGPTLPAFLSPNVISVLVEKFGIGPQI